MSEKITKWRKSSRGNDGDDIGYDDPYLGCCEAVTISGRCHYPGSISHGGHGAKYYCKDHFFRSKSEFDTDSVTVSSHYKIQNPDYSQQARTKLSHQNFLRELGAAIKLGFHAPKTSEVVRRLVK